MLDVEVFCHEKSKDLLPFSQREAMSRMDASPDWLQTGFKGDKNDRQLTHFEQIVKINKSPYTIWARREDVVVVLLCSEEDSIRRHAWRLLLQGLRPRENVWVVFVVTTHKKISKVRISNSLLDLSCDHVVFLRTGSIRGPGYEVCINMHESRVRHPQQLLSLSSCSSPHAFQLHHNMWKRNAIWLPPKVEMDSDATYKFTLPDLKYKSKGATAQARVSGKARDVYMVLKLADVVENLSTIQYF